jgi:hypothetical protein
MDTPMPYDDPAWAPQIIVVGLGSNDYATNLGADEVWATGDALTRSFIAAYQTLLYDLHTQNPTAAILVIQPTTGEIFTTEQAAQAETELALALQDTAEEIGLIDLRFLTTAGLPAENTACHYHGSATDHQARAIWLIDFLTNNPQFWDGQGPVY